MLDAFCPYYLQSNALTPGSMKDYFALTVRDTTNQMVEYLKAAVIPGYLTCSNQIQGTWNILLFNKH